MKPRTLFQLFAILLIAIPLTPVMAQDQDAYENEGVLEEVIVTGIRSSILNAEEVKRDARNIVEAITPEDLGKFSDDSIAESLQRLPGVTGSCLQACTRLSVRPSPVLKLPHHSRGECAIKRFHRPSGSAAR